VPGRDGTGRDEKRGHPAEDPGGIQPVPQHGLVVAGEGCLADQLLVSELPQHFLRRGKEQGARSEERGARSEEQGSKSQEPGARNCSSRLLTWQRDAARAQHQRRMPPVPLTRRGKTARTPTARATSAAGAANMYTVSKAHDDSIAR
jgi:hypothetical protein